MSQFLARPQFQREKRVMLITDCPLANEIVSKVGYSSQSAKNQFMSLAKVGIYRSELHATYLMSFRPEAGDLSAIFHSDGINLRDYQTWYEKGKPVEMLNYAYNELLALKEEIHTVKPDVIICAGRWSLYFLTGETNRTETKKSPYGTLLKWRASSLKLLPFWEYGESTAEYVEVDGALEPVKDYVEKLHVVIPILPADSTWKLSAKAKVIQQDFVRCGILFKASLNGTLSEYATDIGNYIVEPTFDQVRSWIVTELVRMNESKEKIPYAVDCETTAGFMDCIGIAKSTSEAICIPFSTQTSAHYWSEDDELQIRRMLKDFLTHPNCGKKEKQGQYGQNYWYDMQYIWRDLFIKTQPAHDSMVLQHTMFAGLEKSLAFISSMYAKYYKYWKDDGVLAKGKTSHQRWVYNCRDCCYTFEVVEVLQIILAGNPKNIQNAYNTQMYRTLPAVVKMMERGVRQDTYKRAKLYYEFKELIAATQEELNFIIGEPFNSASADQKKTLFYDIWQLPIQYDAKTGQPTTSKEVLQTFIETEILTTPIVNRIAELGQFNTLVSTFLTSKYDIDGRMRCSYNICGTDTFRFSSSENAFGSGGNLQNVSKGKETITGRALPNVRELFLPDEGFMIGDSDLDSADLRIVVAESGASGLQQMLDAGLKPYIEMMKEYYNDPSKNKYSKEYGIFKAVAHGTNYVGSAAGLAARVGLLVHDVDKLQKWYFEANPEIKRWHNELRSQVNKRGWIENIFGYRKYFWDKSIPTLIQIAAAWKPQSTVGLLINEVMIGIDQNLPEVELLLQVHDSVVFQFPIEKKYLIESVIGESQIVLPYETPIVIPMGIATSEISWGHCK